MTSTLLPVTWGYFLYNLLLQVFDGLFTYHVLSAGVPEANPLVSGTMLHWGILWGLLYWKAIACMLLACIFALRHRRRSLAINALKITGAVYSCLAVAGLCELVLELSQYTLLALP